MEGRSKLKVGRKEADDTGDKWPYLEVERSMIRVIRSQVRTASVSKRGPQLVATPDKCVYKYRCKELWGTSANLM